MQECFDQIPPQSRAEELFNHALEREDIIWLVKCFPANGDVDLNIVEYELQLLKIVSIGWAISYYLQEDPLKDEILEAYWQAVRNFADNLSQSAHLLIGKDIAYFEVLKDRLNTYVQAMAELERNADPSFAIGPAFGACCNARDNPFAALTGAKLFANTLVRVREYLSRVVEEDEDSQKARVQ